MRDLPPLLGEHGDAGEQAAGVAEPRPRPAVCIDVLDEVAPDVPVARAPAKAGVTVGLVVAATGRAVPADDVERAVGDDGHGRVASALEGGEVCDHHDHDTLVTR